MDDNTQHIDDTVPSLGFHYDPPTDTIEVFARCVMHGKPHRGWIAYEPIDEGVICPPLFRLSPRRDWRIFEQLKAALGAFYSPAPIVIDLKHFKGLPIESAPKDGTHILVHNDLGWIEADWNSEHECFMHAYSDDNGEIHDADLWLPLPGGGK